jgi:hypothetical protein
VNTERLWANSIIGFAGNNPRISNLICCAGLLNRHDGSPKLDGPRAPALGRFF